MKFKKLNSQSGRSMVEMLGVLAIIGVLSVGGIAGYSLSMRRHRANAVIDAVSKYAALNYGKCQQKLLNGELGRGSTGKLDFNGCYSGALANFDQTDLGQKPSGVVSISHGAVEIGSSDSGSDKVSTYVALSDQKLCQAVASIVGSSCEYWSALEAYGVIVTINQN